MFKNLSFFIATIALHLLSCKQEASAPGYIKIEKFQLNTDYNSQGSSSSKISDVWIYINDQLIGTFELPCEVPVTVNGSNKVSLVAGIKNTGQSGIRDKYIFYKWFDTTIVFNGETNILSPHISYIDSVNFLWNFDFESNSIPMVKDEDSDTSVYLVNNTNDVFEGNGIGEITVDAQRSKAFIKTTLDLNIPSATKSSFLELNYSCSQEVEIGVITYISNIKIILPIVTLKSTNLKWNKIYIDLSNTLGTYALQGKFEIYFQIHQFSSEKEILRLDNLKIISQK